MKFCQYCGKQLADNEACTCCQQAAGQGQPVNGQAQQFNQTQGQPVNGQAQQFNQMQGQLYYATGQQPAENEAVGAVLNLVKGMFKTPVAAISEFVKKANAISCVILIGIFAFIELVLASISIADSSIRYSKYSYAYHMELEDILSSIFSNIIGGVAEVLIIAVVIMVIINAFQKNKKVTFAQALAAACLYDIVYLPICVVGNIIGLIPVDFFGYLNGWLHSFGAAAGSIYTFFAIREIEEDDNKMPIVYATASAAAAVCITIVNLIF